MIDYRKTHILEIEEYDAEQDRVRLIIREYFETWEELREYYKTKYRDHEIIKNFWNGMYQVICKDKYHSYCRILLKRKRNF